MSASVQKLEALLARVQQNRQRPREAAESTAPRQRSSTPLEAAMQDLGVVTPQARPSAKPSSRPPKPTPAARPSVKPPSSQPPREAKLTPVKPVPASVRPTPVKPMPAVPKPRRPTPEPIRATPMKATSPVAEVKSAPTSTKPATFGELLDRALALRPR